MIEREPGYPEAINQEYNSHTPKELSLITSLGELRVRLVQLYGENTEIQHKLDDLVDKVKE